MQNKRQLTVDKLRSNFIQIIFRHSPEIVIKKNVKNACDCIETAKEESCHQHRLYLKKKSLDKKKKLVYLHGFLFIYSFGATEQ